MFRYSAFILFLFCFYSGLAAADKTDDDALLLQLDKMIEQREVYQEKVEKEIDYRAPQDAGLCGRR